MSEESPPPKDDRLESLLDAYFEGDPLDADALGELDEALVGSEDARRRFWERAEVDAKLEAWGRHKRGEATVPADAGSARPWWRQWPAVAGWAAAVVLLVSLLMQHRQDREPGDLAEEPPSEHSAPRSQGPAGAHSGYPVAFLSQLAEVEAPVRYLAGQSVGADEEIRIGSGLLELVFYSGARVIVEGPARVVPRSDLEIEVLEGGVQADVPESAIGFRMVLPDGVVTDFGTSFDVKVEGDRTSRIQVIEGEIEMAAHLSSSGARRLTAGEAVAVDDAGALEDIDFRPMDVGESLSALAARESRVGMQRWREYAARLDRDQSVVVHFSLLPEERGADVVLNHAESLRPPRSGTVISASWAEGRWEAKPALAFRRPSDRVRVDIPGEFEQATFVTWARVDGLPREYNGLFFSEYGIDGEVHWQFSEDGRYYFGVRPEDSPAVSQFHRAFSEPVISPWAFGSWRMLATTYDSRTREVVHYVDAAEVSRTTLEDSIPLRFGRATLGNFFDPLAEEHSSHPGIGTEWSFRNWTGAIDEFILFSRVVPVEELVRIHEAGRVD